MAKVGFHQEVAVPFGGELPDWVVEELGLEVEEAREEVDDLTADLEVEVDLEVDLESDLEEDLEADGLETVEEVDLLALHAEDIEVAREDEMDEDKEE